MSMRSRPIACALLCSSLLLGAAARAGAQGLVGDWGDPQKIVINGARQWPAEDVRRELVSDLETIIAAHPASPLANYPQLLADRVRDGYLKGGFALANVSVRLDPQAQQVIVSIDEGPRYLAGDIRVNGPPGCDAAHIAAWLTAVQAKPGARMIGFKERGDESSPQWVDKNNQRIHPDKPVWEPGKPVHIPTGRAQEYQLAVQRALEQQGYPQSVIHTALVRDDVKRTASLVVVVTDLGRRNRIDRIDVIGSKRDSEADVLRYLGIRAGQVATESHCAQWRHKLWLSGRYLEQEVTIEPAKTPAEEISLKIHLVDYPSAPPLGEQLQAEEQLVLKCGEWMTSAIERGDALIIRGSTETTRLELVTMQDQGTLCLLEPISPGAKPKATKSSLPGPTLLAALPGELLHMVGGGTQLLRAPFHNGRMVVTVDVQPNPDPKDKKHKFALKLGAGFRSSTGRPTDQPFAVSMSIAPVALLAMIRGSDEAYTENGVLTINAGGSTCLIEEETGRLLDFIVRSKKSGSQLSIAIEPGEFGQYLATAERLVGVDPRQTPNAYNSERPVSSTVEFLLRSPLTEMGLEFFDEQKHLSGDLVAGAHALNKLVAGDAFWPIDAYARKARPAAEDAFWIPTSDAKSLLEPEAAFPLSNPMTMGAALLTLQHVDDCVPRESWPWVVSRDAALFLTKQPQFVDGDLRALEESRAMGPIGHLVTAELLEKTNNKTAVQVAQRGLNLLTLENFRADYGPFLDQQKCAGQILLRSAELMSDFTDDEADELGRMLLARDHKLMVIAVRYLREHRSEPIAQALPGMLDHLWDHGLSKVVKARLQGVQSRNEKLVKAKQKLEEQVARDVARRNKQTIATRPSRILR